MPKETTAAPVVNDMFIDTDSFDFLSLDDVVADSNELGYKTKQTGKDLMTKEDISDLGVSEEESEEENEPFDFDSEDDDQEGVEAEEEEGTEEGVEEGTDESDEQEVDFESYEVTLPNGETVVLSDAIKGYKDAKQLTEEKAEFIRLQEDFNSKAEGVSKYLELAKLETDRVIEDYEDFNWGEYKEKDPVGYVENREFLDRYKARRQEIVSAMDEIYTKKQADEAANFQAKAREAGTVLARDIPGWNNEVYQQLMTYAIENGIAEDDIKNTVDPAIFKLLHKAMENEKGKKVITAKVKKLGTPQKVVKATAKPVQATTTKSTENKKAIIKKMENGGLTEKELSNSFAFLED